jgi:hypothetical protein
MDRMHEDGRGRSVVSRFSARPSASSGSPRPPHLGRGWQRASLAVSLAVALVAACALFVVSAIAAGNPADAPRVCVSSAVASFGGGDQVVETKDAIDCG